MQKLSAKGMKALKVIICWITKESLKNSVKYGLFFRNLRIKNSVVCGIFIPFLSSAEVQAFLLLTGEKTGTMSESYFCPTVLTFLLPSSYKQILNNQAKRLFSCCNRYWGAEQSTHYTLYIEKDLSTDRDLSLSLRKINFPDKKNFAAKLAPCSPKSWDRLKKM